MAMTVKQLMDFSWMSQASYLGFSDARDFWLKLTSSPINSDKIFSPTQATAFTDPASGYSFISYAPNDASGFSATLFQDAQGNKYLAIRGTEITSGPDLWTDASLAFSNLLLDVQIPAMLGFYNQLKTDGLIASTDILTVSGHSLGGYLAQLLTVYDFPQISQTYTYNAPGFTGASGLAAGLLGLSDSVIPSQITNIQGMGPNIIAGLGTVIGSEQPVFTEGKTHSVAALTDSLALYNLFATLDPSLNTASADNIGKITGFLKASSNVAANSLENTLDALRTLLQTDYTAGSANLLSSATPIDNREAFYANLQSLQTSLANSSFNLGTAQAPQYGFTLLTLGEAANDARYEVSERKAA